MSCCLQSFRVEVCTLITWKMFVLDVLINVNLEREMEQER